MPKRVVTGVVVGDKMQKTRRVEIPRLVKHPKYGKLIRRKTICYAHDEKNESSTGDRVEIIESRPRSKLKRWELVRVVDKSRQVDVAALKAAQRIAHADAQAEAEAQAAAAKSETESQKS